MAVDKQIIIEPKVGRNHLAKFIKNLEDEGIKMVFADPDGEYAKLRKTKIKTIFPSPYADYAIMDKPITEKLKGKKIGMEFNVSSNKDIENVLDSAKKGLDFVVIEVKDWKIIPLENIIAKLHKIHTKIFSGELCANMFLP